MNLLELIDQVNFSKHENIALRYVFRTDISDLFRLKMLQNTNIRSKHSV